jgi:two-component system phosphate regulon sensor histidine kinase PhoR
LRLRLFVVSLVLVAVSLAVADAFFPSAIEADVTAAMRDDFVVRATLAGREAAASTATADDAARWEALAQSLAHAAQARVTLLRRDGRVLGDSGGSAGERDDIAGAPEVTEALGAGRGAAVRPAGRAGPGALYAAASFDRTTRRCGRPVARGRAPSTPPRRSTAPTASPGSFAWRRRSPPRITCAPKRSACSGSAPRSCSRRRSRFRASSPGGSRASPAS